MISFRKESSDESAERGGPNDLSMARAQPVGPGSVTTAASHRIVLALPRGVGDRVENHDVPAFFGGAEASRTDG